MTAIAFYIPSEHVDVALRAIASRIEFDTTSMDGAIDVVVALIAFELGNMLAQPWKDAAEWEAYFLDAPETRSKALALIQAARTAWMSDPS